MPIKSNITDKKTNLSADVVQKNSCDCHALAVATVPYREFENSIQFFSNPNTGIDMNVDASSGGTPEEIHNGIDDTLWTASEIVGNSKTTFNSTDVAHTGSNSIKVDNADVNAIFQIAKGSDIDLTGYVSITIWIYVDKDWKVGDNIVIYGWDTDIGTQVGNSVGLQNYFSYGIYDVWHQISIPLTDMELENTTTLDAFRFQIISKEGKSPKFYMDDIQIEETGTPISYTISPAKGTWLYINTFTASIANDIAGTLADATFPYLAYDSLLGVTLTIGMTYQRLQSNTIKFSQQITTLMDFMQLAGTEIGGSGSDGTNSWVILNVKHTEPLLLKWEDDDKLRFTVNDDLSGLLHFRISVGCKIEYRNK